MNDSMTSLKKRMKSTAYARFFSARRYDRLNNYSLFSLSISSFTLIFLTLFQKYSPTKIFLPDNLELMQLIASITIAVLSIVVAFSSYAIKSEKMRISGEEINELISRIDFIADLPFDSKIANKVKRVRIKYEVLKSKSLNHKNFEFEYGKAERKREENANEKTTISKCSIYNNFISFIPYSIISIISFVIFLYGLFGYIKI